MTLICKTRKQWIFILCLLFLGLSKKSVAQHVQPGIEETLPPVAIDRYRFSDYDKDAQIWSGMYIASNDKIYIGLCTHGDAATVYEFDIVTRKMRQLANLTKLLDERGKGIWTNGKIHVKMQELDGYVYFGSFCEDNGPPAIDARSYQGPFWFKINMETGEVITLSKINSFWGLIGQEMDKERRIIYGLTEEGHLVRYFIDDDYTEDLGRVDNWDICRTLLIDDIGNVYGSYAPGRIWKFDVEADRIYDLVHTRVPSSLESRTMANPMLDRRSQWRYIEWDPQEKVAYGITGGTNLLFQFDVHLGSEGKMLPLARICAPKYREADPFDIPSATLAMTFNRKTRKIYYLPVVSGDFDYGAVETSNSQSKTSAAEQNGPPLSFMVSYDLSNDVVEDIGTLITLDDNSRVYGMGAADTDAQGRVWFIGAFEEKDTKFVVRNMRGEFPYSLGLGCYKPKELGAQ
ncbi:MAG: hypothetical protein HKN87_13340 [Saprospiraceae bacterium]|nr:hypothetical protein [Saprospiraceae bacterium]